MNIEALRNQLKEGKITKEQFAAELKKLLDAETITQEDHDAAIKAADEDGGGDPKDPPGGEKGPSLEEIQKMIQSETDKVRTEYTTKLKESQTELERLKTEKMTDEQKAEHERQKWETEKAEKEKELNNREIALHTVDKLTDAKLPLSFKSFLAGPSKEDTDKIVADFSTLWQQEIKAAVEAKFKENGGDPPGNKGGGKGPKKWNEMNLTEQGQLYRDNPDKARELAKADGVNLR